MSLGIIFLLFLQVFNKKCFILVMFCWLKKGLPKICKDLVIVVTGGDDVIKLTSDKIYSLVKTKTVRLPLKQRMFGGEGEELQI